MAESIDESVGRVMATLEELQLTENSIIIFTSDNGGLRKATDHAPLRGNKGAYYEGGIRVPLIIKWPGKARSGHVGLKLRFQGIMFHAMAITTSAILLSSRTRRKSSTAWVTSGVVSDLKRRQKHEPK